MSNIKLFFIPLLGCVFAMLGIGTVFAEVNPVTPSTNDINRANGWAHVDVTPGVGSASVNFISTRGFYSCFEYRTDGDTTQKTSNTNYNTDVTDGLYPYYCQNNNTRTVTIPATNYVEIRMVFGAETDERFDWTRFDVIVPLTTPHINGFLLPALPCGSLTNIHSTTVDWTDSAGGEGGLKGYDYSIDYPLVGGGVGHWNAFFTASQYTGSLNEGTHTIKVRARDMENNVSGWSNTCTITTDWTAPDVEINNPPAGIVSGIVDIRGTVTDLHPHHYWLAIYSGSTQIAGPGTVNRSDSFINESLMMWDTSLVPDGIYTIKLEARDAANNKDTGSVDWHIVTVDNDSDHDGVLNINDYCPSTTRDETTRELGINRNIWYGGDYFTSLIPGKKNTTQLVDSFTIGSTHGCSCNQILDNISTLTGDSSDGHYKFGCSKGLIQDWIDGKYFLE